MVLCRVFLPCIGIGTNVRKNFKWYFERQYAQWINIGWNARTEIKCHQPVVGLSDLIGQQFCSHFKTTIPYHDLLAGGSFKFVAAYKVIAVSIIFIAIWPGHI